MSTDTPQSTPNALIAWFFVLSASALPELALGASYPLPLMHWITLSKAGLLIGALIATLAWQTLRPVRALLILLSVIHLAGSSMGSFVASPIWNKFVGGLHNSFVRAMLNVQFVRVAVMLAVLAALFTIYRDRSRFFLGSGDFSAIASRVPWLGISGKQGWNRTGTILAVFLSMGTLTFLTVAMRPAAAALPMAVSMLPLVLLFSATNALGEEITFRLGLLAPALRIVSANNAMLMSAAYFGLAHYYGIPSGPVGVLMAGFLGLLACRTIIDTKGVGWAFIIHMVQDIWIFWFMAAMFSLQVPPA